MAMAILAATNVGAAAGTDCFDALISARIVRQTPSVIPDCGDGFIIMSWPWFIDLDVQRVLRGEAPRGRLTALAVQHTYYRAHLGNLRWWLRRNSAGGFNVLRLEDKERPSLCAQDAAPADPYIHADDDRTLDNYVGQGKGDTDPTPIKRPDIYPNYTINILAPT
jgi:hypothetical protein